MTTATPHDDAYASAGEPINPRLVQGAGGLMTIAALGYLVVEAVVAAAWTDPPYSYLDNLVPSLGSTACGPYNGQLVCSPFNRLMNAMLIGHAVLFGAAGVIFSRLFSGRQRNLVAALSVLYAIGIALVGIFHHYQDMPVIVRVVNIAGAFLAILACCTIAILAGIQTSRLRMPRWAGPASITLGAVGIVTGIVFFGFSIGGLGLRERISIYPMLAWQLLAGLMLLATWRAARPGDPARSS